MQAEQVCKEIIAEIIKDGYQYQISHKDLAKIIMQKRGIDERTVERWINALQVFDYIITESTAVWKVYRLNPTKIPDLFNHLKEKPQTRLS